ncbi:MAG: pyruvate dehydrogenase (acetyl-transferring) E1 component subunit alpha, partial [Firmicutes bacterium]|nr:pyruvate dehydrogenase (acetyl-transferring) E1 component subunit alpha [Bacillota bacterium]
DEERVVEEANTAVKDALEQADRYPAMSVAGLIDTMFETLPADLRAQREQFAGEGK